MSLKLRKPKTAPSFQTLMEEDSSVTFELICLTSNIRKEVCEVLDNFLSSLKKFDERKTHNMLALLLDSKFKNLCLVSFFIGHDQRVTIVEQCGTMSLYHMLIKCYYQLHPLTKTNNGFVD